MDPRNKRDLDSYDDDDEKRYKSEHPNYRSSILERGLPSAEHNNHHNSHHLNPSEPARSQNPRGSFRSRNRGGRTRSWNSRRPRSSNAGPPRSSNAGPLRSSNAGPPGSSTAEPRSFNAEPPHSSDVGPPLSSNSGSPRPFNAGLPLSFNREPPVSHAGRRSFHTGRPHPFQAGHPRSQNQDPSRPPQIPDTNTGGTSSWRRSRSPDQRSSRPRYQEPNRRDSQEPNRPRSREPNRPRSREPNRLRSQERGRHHYRESSRDSIDSRHWKPATPLFRTPDLPRRWSPDPRDTPIESDSPEYLNANPFVVQKDRSAVLQDPEKEPSAARTESLEPQGDIADMPSKFTKESGSKGDADHKGLGSGFKSSFKLNEEESHSESIRQPESSKSDSKSLASESNTNYPEEIQDALNRAQKFVSTTTATFCRDCGQKLLSKFDPIEVYQSWHREGKIDTMSSVICSGTLCQAKVCIGCGKKPKANNPRNSSKFRGETLGWCCEKGRAFAIWVMLCRYDMLEIDLQQSGSQAASVSRGTANPNTGTGYARMSSLTIVAPRRYEISQPLNFKQMDNYTDNLTQEIIGLMLALLPKPGTKAEQEAIAIASMLELSLLQDRVGQLLRNDSIRNVSQRAKLYFEAFEFVQLLAEHENFDYLVTDDRFIKKKSAGLFELTNPFKKESTFQTALVIGNQSEGKASSLLSCMSNLATQSSVFLGLKTGEAREDHTEMAKLIVKIQKSLSPEKASGHQAATWKDYHKDNCFVSKKDVLEQLRYDSKDFAQKIRNPHKYRMGRISSEIAELVTSLPEGIFVIGDEVRIDVMKALIVGPQGTPYEGGLFEFDIVLPSDYPLKPPSVRFLTTNNGTISFNPNLYPNGKVCLSLIGTFRAANDESKWQPNNSTICSVLVSIQAMIFCDHPIENEPGYEDIHLAIEQRKRERDREYNKDQQTNTMRYAILDWMAKSHMRNGIWQDVIKKYIYFNGKALLQKAKNWEASNDTFRYYKCRDPEDYRKRREKGMTLVQEMEYFVGDQK